MKLEKVRGYKVHVPHDIGLKPYEAVNCSVCASKGRWVRRGKKVVCAFCGSGYLEIDGELVLTEKMNMKTRTMGSGKRLDRVLRK